MRDAPNLPPETTLRSRLNTGRILQNYAYAVIISVAIALFLRAAGLAGPFRPCLVFSLALGLTICTLAILLMHLFNPKTDNTPGIILILAGSVVGAVLLVSRVSLLTHPLRHPLGNAFGEHFSYQLIITPLFFGGIAAYFFFSKARMEAVREMAERERADRLAHEKALLEANLKLLQAQIEPHFLFNTLSNVVSLIDTQPAKGKGMLLDLTRYLRTSLARTLPESTTLGQEVEAVCAYLNIHQIRLGERLRFALLLPDALSARPLPPMLLQPLVENAMKHGIEPKVEGGEIRITVWEKEDVLYIEVADTGVGFSSPNAGVGIANVKERLRLMYGDRGRLVLEENTPCGVRAVLEVPHAP